METPFVLYWGTPLAVWMPCGLLLSSEDDSSFKKSSLTRPQKVEAFGDKDVTHLKMYGSVEPYSVDGLPSDLAWTGTFYVNSRIYDPSTAKYFFGTSYSKAKAFNWYSDYPSWIVTDMTRIGDKVYLRFTVVMGSRWIDPEIPGNPEENGILVAWKDTSGNWVTSISMYNVNAEFLHPLPYYWKDYMNDIRPWQPSDDGALSECIRNTITRYTTLDTNSYANLIEVIDLINDIRKGKILELLDNVGNLKTKFIKTFDPDTIKRYISDPPTSSKSKRSYWRAKVKGASKEASGLWLKYRYAYSTTKADLEQACRAIIGEYFGKLEPTRVLRGTIPISNGQLRIKMRLHDKTAPNLEKLLISMNQYGFFPGLYNLWDMIPFSFIADWPSHLGDILQDIDERIYFTYYEVDELLVSRKQILDREEFWGPTTYSWYERELLDEMPQWEIYQEEPKSAKVKIYRTLDALSMAIGVS
jgi:hypothetical protein